MPAFICFSCPHCHAGVTSAPQFAGLSGPCPGCKAAITVPAGRPTTPADPPPEVGKTHVTASPWLLRPPAGGSIPGLS